MKTKLTVVEGGSTSLAVYDEACRAVEAASTVDEVKDIRDKAEAMRHYGRQAKNKLFEIKGAVMRTRSERRLGVVMAEMKVAGAMAKGTKGDPRNFSGGAGQAPPGSAPTLAELGVDKHLAKHARKLAAMPADQFEERLAKAVARIEERGLDILKSDAHVSNNSGENEWYTPEPYLLAARSVLGGFDLDPASSEIANRRVQATAFYSSADSGLGREWPASRIWMNPPYAQPLVSMFATKFAEAVENGSTGIVLVNNATETAWFQTMLRVSSAVCFPIGRVRFLDPEGNPGAPLQGQAILYAGRDVDAFHMHFSSFGLVLDHAI